MENFNKKGIPGDRSAEKEFFSKTQIQWGKTKEEAWNEVSARIGARMVKPLPVLRLRRGILAIAASFLILAGTALFGLFYSKTLTTEAGESKTLIFGDASMAKLNAGSSLTYHPLSWKFARKVLLGGEGYFEVKPGRRFEVLSETGVTTVLGTKFNILARNGVYEVSCLSGKVKVESRATDDAVILQPDEKATLNDHGKLDLNRETDLHKQIGWIRNEWIYTDESLLKVIQDIEIQYNVRISLPAGDSHRFTGGFEKTMPVESVLDLVCTPFGFTFSKKTAAQFEIHSK
jgi:transmembrane sensor